MSEDGESCECSVLMGFEWMKDFKGNGYFCVCLVDKLFKDGVCGGIFNECGFNVSLDNESDKC